MQDEREDARNLISSPAESGDSLSTDDIFNMFLSGDKREDLNGIINDAIFSASTSNPNDFVNKTTILRESKLAQTTAYEALTRYEDLLNELGLTRKESNGNLLYSRRVATFLSQQAAYRKQYGMSINSFIEEIKNTGSISEHFFTDTEKAFQKAVVMVTSHSEKNMAVLAKQLIDSFSQQSRLGIEASSKGQSEQLQEMSEKLNSLAEAIKNGNSQEQLDKIMELNTQQEAKIQKLEDDLRDREIALLNQNKEMEHMREYLNEYLRKIEEESSRLLQISESAGMFGLNRLKSEVKDHLERIGSIVEDARNKLPNKKGVQ